MSDPAKIHRYTGAAATISWDAGRCIHAAECVHRVPASFDPKAKPWIRPDAAQAQALADAVNHCPSGALSMTHADGTSAMATPQDNTANVTAGGPYHFRGKLALRVGESELGDTRLALCRCGGSANKPYCDNSHRKNGFADPGALPVDVAAPPDVDASAPLRIKAKPNGPLQCEGPLTLVGANGRRMFAQTTFLCRCGGSANKPYCDGTHKRNGFTS
jgi:CDGSH-type Zn-finger protein/uncharacterized Fe-S cluster protein YjdI